MQVNNKTNYKQNNYKPGSPDRVRGEEMLKLYGKYKTTNDTK